MAIDVAPDVVDQLMDLYCDWREECHAVHVAYERFAAASGRERPLAFAAYEAALDREEAACMEYAAQICVVAGRRPN